MEHAVRIAWIQISGGRGFLFEHPLRAKSWTTTSLEELKEYPEVKAVTLDMCRFGLQTPDSSRTRMMPAKKPTLIITNIPEIASALNRRCQGHHEEHQLLVGDRRANNAAVYPQPFVDEILKALRKHIRASHFPVVELKDRWEVRHNQLICRHFQPRQQLCTLEECEEFDFPVEKFTGKRTTTKTYEDGSTKQSVDDWRFHTSTTTSSAAQRWTGTTAFDLIIEVMLPADYQNRATWISAAAAHPIQEYVTAEGAFQSEWCAIYPTRKLFDRAVPSAHSDGRARRIPKEEGHERGDEQRVDQELRSRVLPEELGRGDQEGDDQLHPELRRELYRVHRNLGHPDLSTFVRGLRHAGAKQEILAWVKKYFKCPLCERRKKPGSQRPGHLARAMGFNECIGIDLFFFFKDRVFLNVVCLGTSLQIVEMINDKTSEQVTAALLRTWFAHYGAPRMLICDQGGEFVGSKFADTLTDLGVIVHYTDVASPWQNGRVERFGGSFKSTLETVIHELTIQTEEELQIAVASTQVARNRYYDRSGFSPYQRVFGYSPRLPAALLSDDYLDRELHLDQEDTMARAREIRDAAAKAWMRSQDNNAVRRADKANTRMTDLKDFKPNDTVYVWRENNNFRGWSGPGVVVAISENNRSLWVSLRGYLLKVSKEHLRHATSEESLGVELIKVLSAEMLEGLESGNIRHYRDLEEEATAFARERDQQEEVQVQVRPRGQRLPPVREEVDEDIADLFGGNDGGNDDQQSNMEVDQPQAQPAQPQAQPQPHELPALEAESTAAPSESSSTAINDASRLSSRRVSVQVDEGRGGEMSFGPVRQSSERPMPYPFSNVESQPWPTARSNTTLFEVYDQETEVQDGARWCEDRIRGTWYMKARSSQAFKLEDSVCLFSNKDKRFYLTKAKESPGQVEFSKLQGNEKQVFRQARAKEFKSLVDSGAITVLSVEESIAFAQAHPTCSRPGSWTDGSRPRTSQFCPRTSTLAPKSRWCVVGWKDPMVHQIERSAPTPMTSSMYLFMALTAGRQWSAFVKDAKTAFLQSKPTTRKQKLAVKQPSDEPLPGLGPRQMLLLNTEVYGLVSGPAWWRRTFLEVLVKELGYRVNAYDRCVLTLDNESGIPGHPTEGIIVVEVDDILESGNERHRNKMARLEKKLRFGKIINLREHPEGTGFAGRRIMQGPDGSFQYTMADYIKNRLKYVRVERKYLKKDASITSLKEDEINQLRGVVAAINWIAREGRPDVSAAASILSGCFEKPLMQHVLETNQVVDHLKNHHVVLKVHHIPEEQVATW